MSFKRLLKSINACDTGDKSAEQWWLECESGDLMLKLAKKQKIDIKKLTLAKVKCARLVEHLMKDERSIAALDAAEQFANGEISSEELQISASAASAAADTADAAYAAASAAADTADAAYAAADAAASAAYAAYAATDAADAYAAYASASAASASDYTAASRSRADTLKKCADICREVIQFSDLNIGDE